ncbi:MAG: DUF1461 domain-containing protein [Pseudomonadota bacterium]
MIYSRAIWFLLFTCLFISCTYAAWIVLAKNDFLYPSGYKLLHIDKTINEFAPKNRYRHSFEMTDTHEHFRIFSEIVFGVTSDAESLAAIEYAAPDGQKLGVFLTDAEVTHLRDVADLISKVNVLGISSLAALVLLVFVQRHQKVAMPPLVKSHLIAFAILILLTCVIVLSGAERVFYSAHEWIFPKDHQWFFYYEESLMTTLMKAPDLFGFIAAALLILSITFYLVSLYSLKRLFAQRVA